MFTGIVEGTRKIIGVTAAPKFHRLTLAADWPDVKIGDSIAVNGCCLTVAQISPGKLGFDIVAETWERTNLGLLKAGGEANVERSLRVGDRLDGHFVQGHIDTLALLTNTKFDADEWRLTLECSVSIAKYLIPKGSVALDGVSLTLAAVRGNVFEVALIPTTIRLTTIADKRPNWCFNLEADILSKTTISWLERREIDAAR